MSLMLWVLLLKITMVLLLALSVLLLAMSVVLLLRLESKLNLYLYGFDTKQQDIPSMWIKIHNCLQYFSFLVVNLFNKKLKFYWCNTMS